MNMYELGKGPGPAWVSGKGSQELTTVSHSLDASET